MIGSEPAGPPRPGDWAVVDTGTNVARPIRVAEWIADGFRPSRWDHVCIASRWDGDLLMIVEAESAGARETAWHYQDRPHKWSTGYPGVPYCPRRGQAAIGPKRAACR